METPRRRKLGSASTAVKQDICSQTVARRNVKRKEHAKWQPWSNLAALDRHVNHMRLHSTLPMHGHLLERQIHVAAVLAQLQLQQ